MATRVMSEDAGKELKVQLEAEMEEISSSCETTMTAEQTVRGTADTQLQENIDALQGSLEQELATEQETRAGADETLQGNIDTEASERQTEDENLQSQIDALKNIVTSGADGEIDLTDYYTSTQVDNAIKAAQETLQGNIDAEASERQTADDQLAQSMTEEQSARESADTAEATVRAEADTNLQKSLTSLEETVSGKQDTLTAGEGVEISEDNVISCTVESVTYTAGDGVTISEDNVISAEGKTYTAGEGVEISEDNVISVTDTYEAVTADDVDAWDVWTE